MKAALQKDNPRDKYACEKQSDKDFVKKNAGVKQTVLIKKICADRNNGKYYQIKVAYLGIEMIVSFHGVFVLSSYAIQNYCRIFSAAIGFLFHKNIIATINQKEKTVFQAKSERGGDGARTSSSNILNILPTPKIKRKKRLENLIALMEAAAS